VATIESAGRERHDFLSQTPERLMSSAFEALQVAAL
jgi:hypothetical protein